MSLWSNRVVPLLDCIPGLSGLRSHQKKYLIIGGGKTGIDAVLHLLLMYCTVLYCTVQVLHLLGHGVQADRVAWVVPNDAWFFDRLQLDGDVYSFMRNRHISGV